MMTSSRSKFSPYLAPKVLIGADLPPAFVRPTSKCSESAVVLKPKIANPRSISPEGSRISSMPSLVNSQDKLYLIRGQSQDIELRCLKRPLHAFQANKARLEMMTSKLTPKSRPKNESLPAEANQPSVRCLTSETNPFRTFRIRGGALHNYSPCPSTSDNSKSNWSFQRRTTVKTGSLASVDSEAASPTNQKTCELSCVNFVIPNQTRAQLPLLVVHFEGIMGSCLIANKERKGNSSLENNLTGEYFFIKKDVKNELKLLSKTFLIAVVFPALGEKYMAAVKFFITKRFPIDAMYSKTASPEIGNINSINKFILDYSVVMSDFKVVKTQKNVVILLPLNLSSSVIKAGLLSGRQGISKQPLYDKSTFVHFFPKLQMNPDHVSIICLPNFVMEEKNESNANLVKSEFAFVTQLAQRVIKVPEPEASEHVNHHAKTENDQIHQMGRILRSQESNIEEDLNEQMDGKEMNKNVREFQKPLHRKSEKESLKRLNLSFLIKELEKMKQASLMFRKIDAIKEGTNIIRGQTSVNFDLSQMRQKLVEDLAEAQKTRRARSGSGSALKVSIVGVVASLFNSNGYLFRLYERDGFYNNKKGSTIISEITKQMKKRRYFSPFQQREKTMNDIVDEDEDRKEEQNGRESNFSNGGNQIKTKDIKGKKRNKTTERLKPPSRMIKTRMAEQEEETSYILLIKRLATIMRLYIEDEKENENN